jgi:putative flavoprotein involved in K+ transport
MPSLPRRDTAVLRATGHGQDFGWIDLPITDEWGFVRQSHGVTEVPGLYLLGSLWQVDQTSATLVGLPRDARLLAARIGLLRDGAEAGPTGPA